MRLRTAAVAAMSTVLVFPTAGLAAPASTAAAAGGVSTIAVGSTPDVVPVIAIDPHRGSTSAPRVVVRGVATPGAVLAIDGHRVGVVDTTGHWRVRLRLRNGVNAVTFGIADQAGYATERYTIRHTAPFTVTKASLPDGSTQVRISCHQTSRPCQVTLQLIGYGDKAHAKSEKPLTQKSLTVAARHTRTLRLLQTRGKVFLLALKGNPAEPHIAAAAPHLLTSAADPAKKKKKKKEVHPRGSPAALNVVATNELSTTSTSSSASGDDDPTTGQASAPASTTPPPAMTDPAGAAVVQSAPVLVSGMFAITDAPGTPAPAVVVPPDPDAPVSAESDTTILGYYVDDGTVYETDDVMTTYTYSDGVIIVQDQTVSVADETVPPGTDAPIVEDSTSVSVPKAVAPPPVDNCAYNIGSYVGANSILGPGPCS